jgi:hypothetical protein
MILSARCDPGVSEARTVFTLLAKCQQLSLYSTAQITTKTSHILRYILHTKKGVWDVTSCRLIAVPSSSLLISPWKMDFSLTAWPEVNALWTSETSVNTYQLVKLKFQEDFRSSVILLWTRKIVLYLVIYIFYVNVISVLHSLQLNIRLRPVLHPRLPAAVLRFKKKRPSYLIWDSSNIWVRVEVILTWYGAFTGRRLRRMIADTQGSCKCADHAVGDSRQEVVS